MFKTIGTFCVMLERKKYVSSCKVLKDWRYESWLRFFNGRDMGEISYVQNRSRTKK